MDRQIYLDARADRCVWSMRKLDGRQFTVDHLIPFALSVAKRLFQMVNTQRSPMTADCWLPLLSLMGGELVREAAASGVRRPASGVRRAREPVPV
jgi:hypothetical protein